MCVSTNFDKTTSKTWFYKLPAARISLILVKTQGQLNIPKQIAILINLLLVTVYAGTYSFHLTHISDMSEVLMH